MEYFFRFEGTSGIITLQVLVSKQTAGGNGPFLEDDRVFIPLLTDALVESGEPTADLLFTIGQAAAVVGIEAKTIRFYEKMGLFSPARASGLRVFRSCDIFKLKLIRALRSLHVNVKDIRHIINSAVLEGEAALKTPAFLNFLAGRIAEHRKELEVMQHNISMAETFLSRTSPGQQSPSTLQCPDLRN